MTALPAGSRPSPARTGVWVGIAAISMSFAAYTSALVVRQGAASDWLHFRLPPILYLNTVILLGSSITLETARRRTLVPSQQPAVGSEGTGWLLLTLGLGVLFLAGQVAAWRDLARQGLFVATNPSSAFFYVLTALHAIHLFGGVVALAYMLQRLARSSRAQAATAFGAVTLYWHFMGVLWVYLLVVLALRL